MGLRRRAAMALARVAPPSFVKEMVYSLYSARLLSKVLNGSMPRHIGVVLDGNRRYAAMNGYSDPMAGHWLGTRKVDDLLSWCDTLDIPVVTLWSLSIDNLRRDPEELQGLFEVLETTLPHLRDAQTRARHPRRIRACGRTELLPESLRGTVAKVESDTEGNSPYQLNIALGYGGREEIVDAVKTMLLREAVQGRTVEEIAEGVTPARIAGHLYLNGVPDPDLIIRTSGEVRLGGFLLWGSAYSEYYFCDALWPAFRKMDFLRAIRSYQHRQRRYGH